MAPASLRLAPVLLLLALAACESSIDPFVEEDLYFSMYGYLDAAADTQYVRITPIRRSIETDPGPLGATVTSRSLTTGEEHVWNEEIRRTGDGKYAHIFWTADSVAAGDNYVFFAENQEGEVSSATVEIPPDFPQPEIFHGILPFSPPPYSQSVTVRGAENVADITLIYTYRLNEQAPLEQTTISYAARIGKGSAGHLLSFNAFRDLQATISPGSCPIIVDAEVIVMASNEEWPDLVGIPVEDLAIPGAFGNVEHGVGFIGGVLIKRFPFPGLAGASQGNRNVYCGS